MVYLECPGFLAQLFKKVRMVEVKRVKEGEVGREQGGVERGYKTYRREIFVKPSRGNSTLLTVRV